MEQSGLVEIASHTHDMHKGVNANPAGSKIPAAIVPEYKNGQYETKESYQKRLLKDFKTFISNYFQSYWEKTSNYSMALWTI
mgnify:CR=1 FL=1